MGELIETTMAKLCDVAEGKKGEMAVLDRAGDLKTIWDSGKPEEVAIAKKQFEELKKKGYVAYKVKKDGDKGELMKEFDPEAEKVILAPLMQGG